MGSKLFCVANPCYKVVSPKTANSRMSSWITLYKELTLHRYTVDIKPFHHRQTKHFCDVTHET